MGIFRIGLLLTIVCSISPAAFAGGYSVIAIKVPDAGQTIPTGINNNGWIVGVWKDKAGDSVSQNAFFYDTLVTHTFGVPFTSGDTVPAGISNENVIAGTYQFGEEYVFGTHGFTYGSDGFKTIDFPGSRSTTVCCISHHGTIAGVANLGGVFVAYVYMNGVFKTIPTINTPSLVAVTNSGSVAGNYTADLSGGLFSSFGYGAGFVYTRGKTTTVSSEPFPSVVSVLISGMNDNGVLVGREKLEMGGEVGYYSRGSIYTPCPSGHCTSQDNAINDNGVFVGVVTGATPGLYVCDACNATTSIDIFGSPTVTAVAINNKGQITGTFVDTQGITEAYIATPVP